MAWCRAASFGYLSVHCFWLHHVLHSPNHVLALGRDSKYACDDDELRRWMPEVTDRSVFIDAMGLDHLLAPFGKGTSHCGTNTHALLTCVRENKPCVEGMLEVVAKFVDAMPNDQDCFIVFFCKWGKHRSL